MSKFLSISGLGAIANSGLGRAVLPKAITDLLITLEGLQGEAKILSDRMSDPVNGPLLPFCTTQWSFDTSRISFCVAVAKDSMLLLAGGTGIATLAQTLASQPDQMYMFLREVLLPTINQLAAEGHGLFKQNMDRALGIILGAGINTDYIMGLDLEGFLGLIGSRLRGKTVQPTLHNCRCNCTQQGGSKYTKVELQNVCRQLGLSCRGTKAVLMDRIMRSKSLRKIT